MKLKHETEYARFDMPSCTQCKYASETAKICLSRCQLIRSTLPHSTLIKENLDVSSLPELDVKEF